MGNDQSAANGNAAGANPASGTPTTDAFGKKLAEEKVLLNVYEPRDKSQSTGASFGFGVYHTGLEVYGTEYMFAGGEGSSGSGIHPQTPRVSPPGSPWVYLKTADLGKTVLTRAQIQDLISRMGSEYPASTYHVMARNCNHFTDDLSKRITTGKSGIPGWVNRAANLGNSFFGPSASSVAAPKAEQKPSVFAAGGGHTLSSGAAPPQPQAKGSKAAAAPAADSKAAQGSGEKRNPWRDPNFVPPGAKKESVSGGSRASSAGSSSSSSSSSAQQRPAVMGASPGRVSVAA